jgi:hypothetical protein
LRDRAITRNVAMSSSPIANSSARRQAAMISILIANQTARLQVMSGKLNPTQMIGFNESMN